MPGKIGILALQGGFDLHASRVGALGATPLLVKKREQLAGLDGLIIPGGESSVLLHLTDTAFREDIKRRAIDGLPILGTCAGIILLAHHVENPVQESLGLLPVTVQRNAYGRQVDSFVARAIPWTSSPSKLLDEAVFIRAPRITTCEKEIEVLIALKGDPILVKHKNIVGATFHPELSENSAEIYQVAFPRVFQRQPDTVRD